MKLKAYTVNDLDNIGEIITISHDYVDGNNNSLKTFKTNNTIYILNDIVNKIADNNPLYTPIVDSVSPNFTSYDTGVLVRVKGKNLSNLKSIKIQDIDVKIETFNIISDETIDVMFPPISQSYPNNNPFVAGLKSILFTFNTEFTIVLENAFTYYLPAAVINQSAICPGGGTLCNGVGVYNNGQLDTRGIIIQWKCSDCATCNFTQPRYAKIYRDNKLIATTESGAVEYVDRTYTPGILHSYTIKCILPQGNISSFTSAPVVLVYPLSKPIGVIASDRLYTNKIKITWNRFVNWGPYVDGGEGFNIYRNGSTTKLNSSPITTLEYNDFDSALIPETAYTYRVQTVTGIYVSSLSDSATGYKLLGPPSSIEASDGLYPDKVKIEWGALPNVTNYKVYREGTLIHTETSANFYYDTTGALNTEYLYGVSSVLGSKESTIITDVGFSYIIVKPVINSATLDSASGNITISWQLFSGADSYYLYRDGVLLTSFINSPTTQTYTDTTTKTGKCYSYTLKAESNSVMSALSDAKNLCVPLNAPVNLVASTSDSTDSTQLTLTWSPPTPLKLPVGVGVKYHVYRNNILLQILLVDDILTYEDLSAAIGVYYTYKIKAQIIIDSIEVLSDFSNFSIGIRPGVPILPPTSVSATDGTNANNITVTWQAEGPATSYNIWREVSVGGVWSTPENIGNQDYSDSAVLTTKTNSLGSSPLTEYYKQYRYSVVANESGTSSDYSLTDTGYLKPIIGSFSISASTTYDSKIQISWSSVTGTEGYEIYRSTSAGSFYTKIGTSSTTNYDDTDSSLIANTSYYYKVKTIFLSATSDLSTQYATGIKIPVAPRIPNITSITDIYYLAPLQYGECCQSDRTGSLYRIKFIGTNLDEIDKIYFGTVLSVFDHINTTDGSYIYRIPQQQGTDKIVNIYITYGNPVQTITWPTQFTYFGAPVIDTPSPALIINDWNRTHTIKGTDLQPLADAGRIFTIRKLELFSELNPSNTYDLMGQIGSSTNNAIQISDVPFMNDWSVNPGTGLIGLRIETFLDIGSYGSFTFSTTKNNYLQYQNAIPKQPTITNVTPSFGRDSQIPLTDFIITGTYFNDVDEVNFLDPSLNEYSVEYTVNSDTQITVLAAKFPSPTNWSNQFWGIKVRTSYQGTILYATYSNAYRFIGLPTVTSPSNTNPKYVSTVTPTPITITGTNFIELNSGIANNNVTLIVSLSADSPIPKVSTTSTTLIADSPITTASNTTITTTVPAIAHPHGQKRSLLIEEDYTKSGVATAAGSGFFSIVYCQPPTAPSYTPNSGTTSTPVTITGTNFLIPVTNVNVSTVKFGGTTASFTGTQSNTSLTVLAPALSGVQSITVETPGGTVTVGSFTYNTLPSITSVSPSTAYVNTSTPITINGTNLLNVDSVTINGISVTGTITPNSVGTQIPGIFAPSISTPGVYSLVVSKPGGITASTNFTYNYPPPTITGVNPNTGILAGGTSITITGTNFITGATTVKVGSVTAVTSVVTATSITAVTPTSSTAGARDVAVTTAGGTVTSSGAFTYTDSILATITGVNPQYGPVAGGTSIAITGTSLTGTTSVTVGDSAATSISVNGTGTSLTALTPVGTAGLAKDIIVTTPINAVTSTGAFTYYGLPVITGVSPSTQTIGSLSNITITGSNLDSTSSVTIGGGVATIVGTPNSTSVVVIPPSTLTSGSKTISLTTLGGTNTSFSVTYNLSTPTGVTATDGTDNNKVAISWGSVSGASSYDVYIGASKINTSTITSTSYDDTTATPGTTYAYTVKAKDATGSSSVSLADNGWRNTQPPTGLSASDGTYTDKVVITWTNPTTITGITSYSLFRGTTEITSVTSGYNDTAATPGISYTYTVKSVSASGTSLSNPTDTGYTKISAPTALSASDGSYTDKVALAWTVPTTGTVTGFDVYRDTTKITSLGPTITSYNDINATEGISYTYTIKSNSQTGDSSASTSNAGWRNIGPPIGTITATTSLLDKITIAWTAVTSATGYNIYRNGTKVNGSVIAAGTTTYDDIHNASTNNLTVEQSYSYTIESVTAAGVSATKSTAVTGKRVAIPTTLLTASQGTSTSGVTLNWTDVSAETEYVLYKGGVELSRPLANITTYTDTTGSVGTPFTYEIAVNTAEAGLGSRTSATGWKKIAAPALTLTQQENQLTVSWSAITGANDYEVVNASGTSTTTSTTFINSGLSNPNNLYTITVKARYLINSVYYSSDTSSINGYTLIAPPSTAPSASTTDTAKIVVSWNVVTGASSYEVYRSDNYGSVLATVSTTLYNDAAATAGTSYKYKIKSVCTNSTSAFSGESLDGVKPLLVYPPTGVTASYGTYTEKIIINWVHAASYDTYKLYYKDSGGVYQPIASGLTGNTYTHVPPELLEYYEYYLTTVKSTTESGYSLSDTGCFDIYQQQIQCNIGYRNCLPITDLAASYETSASNISLKWTPYASSTGLTQYEIIRSRQQGTGGEDGFQVGGCAFTGYISNSVLYVTSINTGNSNWKILPNHTVFEQNQGNNWSAGLNTVILSQLSAVGAPGGVGTYKLYSCDSTGWQTSTVPATGTLNFISTLTTLLNQTVSTSTPSWTTNFSDIKVDGGYDTYYKIRPYKGIGAARVYGPQSLISKRYIGNPASYDNATPGGGRRLMSLPKFISTTYPTGNNNNPLSTSINMPYYIGDYTYGAIKIEIYRDNIIVYTNNIAVPSSAMAGLGSPPSSQPYNDTTALSYIPYEYYIKQTINNTEQDQISAKRVGIRGAIPTISGATVSFYTKIDVSWGSLGVLGNSVSYDVYRDGILLGNTSTLSYTDTLGAYCSFNGSISSDSSDKTKATLTTGTLIVGLLTVGQYLQDSTTGSVIDKGWKVTGVSGVNQNVYTIQNMLVPPTSRTFDSNWTSGESLNTGVVYQIKANITNTFTSKSIVLSSLTNNLGAIKKDLPATNVNLNGFKSGSYLAGGPMDVGGVISLANIVAAEGCGDFGTIVYIDNLGRMDYTYSGTVATNTVEARTYLKSIWPAVKCVKLSANSGGSSIYQYFGVVLSNGKLLMWGTNNSTSPNNNTYITTTMKNVCGGKNSAVVTTDYTMVGATSKLYLSNATNYADIACGGYHAIALFTDGKVYSSVGNTQTTPPLFTSNTLPTAESAKTFTKVAAGNYHSIGLRTDGTVVCWGYGATNTGSSLLYGQAVVPTGLGTCIDIAAGGYVGAGGHSVAVKSNGDVWAWGANGDGQCGGTATTSKSGILYDADGTQVTGVSKVSAGTGSTTVITPGNPSWSTRFIGHANAGNGGEVGIGTVSYISCRHYTNIALTALSSLVDIQYWKYYTEITNYNYDTPEIGNKSYKITKTFAHFGDLFTNDSEPIQDYYEGVYKVSVYRYEEKQFNNQTTNVIPLNETIYERTEILYNTYSFENETCPFKDESGTYSSETQCVIGDDLGRVNIDPNIYCRITFSNNTSSIEFNETNYSTFANTINICDCFGNKYLTEGLI